MSRGQAEQLWKRAVSNKIAANNEQAADQLLFTENREGFNAAVHHIFNGEQLLENGERDCTPTEESQRQLDQLTLDQEQKLRVQEMIEPSYVEDEILDRGEFFRTLASVQNTTQGREGKIADIRSLLNEDAHKQKEIKSNYDSIYRQVRVDVEEALEGFESDPEMKEYLKGVREAMDEQSAIGTRVANEASRIQVIALLQNLGNGSISPDELFGENSVLGEALFGVKKDPDGNSKLDFDGPDSITKGDQLAIRAISKANDERNNPQECREFAEVAAQDLKECTAELKMDRAAMSTMKGLGLMTYTEMNNNRLDIQGSAQGEQRPSSSTHVERAMQQKVSNQSNQRGG